MMVCNHDILVSTLGLDGEPTTGVVGVETVKQKLAEVQFGSWLLLWHQCSWGAECWSRSGRLRGAHMMPCLEQVPFDGGISAGAVSCVQGVHEPGPRGIVSKFDG